ncbi:uncharacterized protein PV07_05918 [Cladophialophora immunda]|uniref:Uncharacterized protein n=1 Tax=Cladophialophora immunda TaxID=569365 RepID=A0A0D2D361_9EURO|nr:uncharacterized protein PV07_05918 [Cladophialophora immunda]KIW30149.1 hypothetical protein PV07_05918 [Cladophialophora immunda]
MRGYYSYYAGHIRPYPQHDRGAKRDEDLSRDCYLATLVEFWLVSRLALPHSCSNQLAMCEGRLCGPGIPLMGAGRCQSFRPRLDFFCDGWVNSNRTCPRF